MIKIPEFLEYGCLCKPLSEQLGFTDKHIQGFEEDSIAISRCYIKDFISDNLADKARKKLAKRVGDYLMELKEKEGKK